jgi:glycosyltransferase involved in cell wall biosynthesis
MFLIPCAVDNVFFRKYRLGIKESRQLRSKFGVSDDDFIVLFSARFTARKRPLDLIEAVSKIYNKNIVLLFVGDGPEKHKMEKFAQESNIRCIFTGFVGQKKLPSYYSIANMYAIVSDYDASPKSLNEALNFELPILATDGVGTAVDLVIEDSNGFIVSSRDINTIANKIDFFNNNRKITVEMGKNSLPLSNKWSIEGDVAAIKKAISYFAIEV